MRELAQSLGALCWLVLAGFLLSQKLEPPVPIWPSNDEAPADLKGQYVYWDPRAWQIVVVLPGALLGKPSAPAKTVRIPFKNRFDPHISATVELAEGKYVYGYFVRNGSAGNDPIRSWAVVTPCSDSLLRLTGPHCGRAGMQIARQFELPHIKERGCYARCFTDVAQRPGSPPAQIAITSTYKPGPTTASASNYPPFEVPRDWPEPVLLQLSKLGDSSWADMHIATIGPRFGPDTPIKLMAADFRDSLNDLVQGGVLSPGSAFVSEARALLSKIAQAGERGVFTIRSRPATELESEILEAASISLKGRKSQ